MHIFPFSPREGTPAAQMKNQIPEDVKRERAHRLEVIGRELSRARYERALGEIRTVLFESRDGDYFFGHAEDMLEIYMKTTENLQGQILRVRLTEYDGERMIAVPME
jgi:threonylcarbamoyladenosine tRNA methylthiotransferase MtaB